MKTLREMVPAVLVAAFGLVLFGTAAHVKTASAQALVVPSITIKWGAVTTMNDGTPVPSTSPVSYNLYGGHSATGPWSAPITILGTSTVRNGVNVGVNCYYLEAVVNKVASVPTIPQCVTVAAVASTVPATPGALVIQLN